MIQLKVYDSPAKETQHWIDLYDSEPIKLTLSIEDITNTDTTSTFSRTFKVPGTRSNAAFFKNAFDVDGILYDVTVKKPAEILVGGAEFKTGHIRLQRIYLNTQLDRVDYELIFFGETRDFSSIIGDRALCELSMPDLIGGDRPLDPDVITPFTAVSAQLSWQAYPQAYIPSTGVPYTPSLTTGLHNGNIIYPLIDHGNTYTEAGAVEQTRIALDGTPNFTQNANQLDISRLKPMIRAKRIIDQIFEDAGFTYTSDFFDSEMFHSIYISAFGNEATVGWSPAVSSTTSLNVASAQDGVTTQGTGPLTAVYNWIDGGNNLSQIAWPNANYLNQSATVYTIPTAGDYTFAANCFWQGSYQSSNYINTYVNARLHLWNVTTNLSLHTSNPGSGIGTTLTFSNVLLSTGAGISIGDEIALVVIPDVAPDNAFTTGVNFNITSAPGVFNPAAQLDCQYKQIDFLKDILTSFRLVMAPDTANLNNFIVEPWQTYINSGDLHDWSKKLVENKEFLIEPIFFTQSADTTFSFKPAGDYSNVYHQQAYSNPYGWLNFSSANDLLKGTREIKVTGISPTIISRIEGDGITFVLPQLHTHSAQDTGLQHLPIKAATKMLFYNGMQPSAPLPESNHWFLNGSTGNTVNGDWNIYPLVSSYENWPITTDGLNLNFANDIQYFGISAGYNNEGKTLYSEYWSRYINSLYNKYSRRVTAYFVLNNIDLNNFSFDDTIFVNGTYYRPERIIDVQIGDYTEVQVQLITANDFKPSSIPNQTLLNFSATAFDPACEFETGYIQITTDGTPGFTWSLDNGMTGGALGLAPVGASPYVFDIIGLAPGDYTVTVTDSLGRTNTDTVTILPSEVATPSASHLITNATDCSIPCNGEIAVAPAGGSGAPYQIVWYDDELITSFTRTDLCPDNYSYYVIDVNGCQSPSYLAIVECDSGACIQYTVANSSTGSTLEYTYLNCAGDPEGPFVVPPNDTSPSFCAQEDSVVIVDGTGDIFSGISCE